MAAKFSCVDMDFFCPICCGIFKNPVLLSCSHSFCKDCVERWWLGDSSHSCPVCRAPSAGDPPRNLALKNLCESFSLELSLEEKATEALCSLHSEKLKFFCLNHKEALCVVCRDSKAHANHRFRPIDEAADDYREELRKYLNPVQDKVAHLKRVKVDWDRTADHIRAQAESTERQIREEFKKLHTFLDEEEKARIAALKREEAQKSATIKTKISDLRLEIATLSLTAQTTEAELKCGSATILRNYKPLAERTKEHLMKDPELDSGALIDVAKHLGNLTFDIWNKMKEMVTYSPVILDPNTVGSNIIVSNDLTSLRNKGEESEFLQNPEGSEVYSAVIASEGFNSGTHSWDVEVRSDANWAVGVMGESVSRTGEILKGYWNIWFSDGKYRAYAPPNVDKVLSVKRPLQRIRVKLNWNKGKLSFTDLETNTNIYTFFQTFSQRLYPLFNTLSTEPLRVLQQKITVQLEP
ncbi:E3 ubiquitin-protein ligase TRIM39-like [Cheilinus undulatus]|uniref:E3 ubiquitin-protein ligase TRIM39-like n=1 Tax=Cheilinus undulatus TaxID=241271 RepID=UPI001BD6860D|nr:E3 ubiquitin-protein ligase TRIM39-like [Cheilinus undulatus]